ncbi:MAG: DUF1499 domain-containing protein [Motiliproteus sp.]
MGWIKILAAVAAVLILLLLIVVAGLFFYKGHVSRAGSSPGLVDGRLQACPSTPNCISSEAAENSAHRVEMLTVKPLDDHSQIQRIQAAIVAMGGTILQADEQYLAATFTSSVFGFVDDLEVRKAEGENQYYIRSASRVGHSDMNANRNRVENIRSRLQ